MGHKTRTFAIHLAPFGDGSHQVAMIPDVFSAELTDGGMLKFSAVDGSLLAAFDKGSWITATTIIPTQLNPLE